MLAGLAAGLVAHWSGQLFLFPLVELEPLAWLLAGTLVAATGSTPEPAARRCQERPRNDAGTPPQANLRRLVAVVSTERRRFDAARTPGSATPGELAASSRRDVDRMSQVRRRSIAGSAAPGELAASSRHDDDRKSQVRGRSTAGDATPGELATSGQIGRTS